MLTYFKFQMKARARIFVSGRVQGVFFRDHTQKWASSLTLTGWVRNIRDGRVEALAEGDKEKIDELISKHELISKLNKGPPLSQVENVDVNWEEFKGEFKDFQVTFSDF
jgi:acylphosphatase